MADFLLSFSFPFPLPKRAEAQVNQQQALSQLVSILEEVIAVVKEITPDYASSFNDAVVDTEDPNAFKLRQAIDKIGGMLTKLHTLEAGSDDSNTLQSEVVDVTKSILPDLQVGEDAKAEFVTAIKQGLGPSHKDFFESQKRLSVLSRPKATLVEAVEDDGSKDLIAAAKSMLSALSGISDALVVPAP